MAIRGQLSGCYLLSEEEYRSLRDAQADAAHWRAEHDRVCRALDAANVRADGADELHCQNVALTEMVEELRQGTRGLVGGQESLMRERDEARAACERLAVDLSRARLATEQEEAKVTRVMAAAIERDKEVAQLRSENAALREGQPLYFCVGLVPHRAVPHVVSVRVKYLSTDAAQGEDATEAQGEAEPAPRPTANYRATKLDPARRVPLHAVRPDERRE